MHRRQLLRGLVLGGAALAMGGTPGPSNGSARGRRVAVVGAGLAGLACAYELLKAGHNVTVLEAQALAGGRVRTLREAFLTGHDVELGAVDFGDGYATLMRYQQRFNLDLDSPPVEALPTVCYVSGRRYVVPVSQDPPWDIGLTDAEARLGRRGLEAKYLTPRIRAIGNPLDVNWSPARFVNLDRYTLDALLEHNGASAAARSLLRLALDGDDLIHVSALLSLALRSFYGRSSRVYRLRGGNDRLPAAFVRELGSRVAFEQPVIAITVRDDSVALTVQSDGRQLELSCDAAVLAVPYAVLRSLPISGSVPEAKRKVIETLPYEPLTRVYLNYSSRPWERDGVQGTAYTDLPIGPVIDHSAGSSRRGGVLEAQLTRAGQARFQSLAVDERMQWVVGEVDRVHPGSAAAFISGFTYIWDQDPWARGAWAYYPPGGFTRDYPLVAAPVGRLHFAGEHTSTVPSTMEGALVSGVRAAHEVAVGSSLAG